GANLAPQRIELLRRQLENEVVREALPVPCDRSIQGLGLDAVERSKMSVEHHLVPPHEQDAVLQRLGSNGGVICAVGPPPHHRPSSAMLVQRPRPITTWSRTRMPTSSPAWRRRWVMAQSSADGVGSPLGWLWTRMSAAAAARMAGAKTSRGWTSAAVSEPSETHTSPCTRFLPSSRRT